jgi:hypothetical protein
MGGDEEDTKRFIRLKEDLPELEKMTKNIVKSLTTWKNREDRKNNTNVLSQFNSYSGFGYS